jgi:hypothetical protein
MTRRRVRLLALALGWVLAAAFGGAGSRASAQPDGSPRNLLLGKSTLEQGGVRNAEVLTDGRASRDGGSWRTRLTALLFDASAFVTYDLGEAAVVRALWLQGDHNDRYRVELSSDGRTFTKLWDAGPVRDPGLQPRVAHGLRGKGRYLRIRPLSGDGNFSLSEVQAFAEDVSELPAPRSAWAPPLADRLRDHTLLFGLGLIGFLLVPARSRRWLLLLLAAGAAFASWQLARALYLTWPADPRALALIRATVAFVAAAAVAREAFAPRRWPACRPIVLTVLGTCGMLALAAFYNLAHPQFYNEQTGRWTFAHYLDLRQYYPTAKYIGELGYVGIYDADLAAYFESHPERRAAAAELPVRDLATLAVVRVADRSAEIAAIPQRFSPERWQAYARDAAWFRSAMGETQYFETLLDYGGNATPLWIALAHVLFDWVSPSDAAFSALGLLDLGLLLATFVAIACTFGPRSAFVSLVIFGANDFVMYGTNWSGATLRHDWLAYLGLGACALRREHWRLGGALLALAALIRAFPLLALAGLTIPVLWRLGERLSRKPRTGALAELVREERVVRQVALGALLAVGAALAVSSVVVGPGSWLEWLSKVTRLDSDPHFASVALRNLIAGSDDQARLLRARWPIYALMLALGVAAVALAARSRRPEQAALLGLFLVPVLFYPTTYYLHLVYLFALVVDEEAASGSEPPRGLPRATALVWITLLLLCAAQYFATLVDDFTLHFYLSTVLLFTTLTVVLTILVAADPRVHAFWHAEGGEGSRGGSA